MLVTGDGDLIHALNFLRLHGRRVIIIGVGDTMNTLLSTAADTVLLYERDIEPIANNEPYLSSIMTTSTSILNMDDAFEWVKEILRQNENSKLYPFTKLGHELKQHYGFDARSWYRIPFKRFMLDAQAAGHVHLSTIAGLDYASLTDVPEPQFDAPATAEEDGLMQAIEQEVDQSITGLLDIQFKSLSDDEQRSLVGFIHQLQNGIVRLMSQCQHGQSVR